MLRIVFILLFIQLIILYNSFTYMFELHEFVLLLKFDRIKIGISKNIFNILNILPLINT